MEPSGVTPSLPAPNALIGANFDPRLAHLGDLGLERFDFALGLATLLRDSLTDLPQDLENDLLPKDVVLDPLDAPEVRLGHGTAQGVGARSAFVNVAAHVDLGCEQADLTAPRVDEGRGPVRTTTFLRRASRRHRSLASFDDGPRSSTRYLAQYLVVPDLASSMTHIPSSKGSTYEVGAAAGMSALGLVGSSDGSASPGPTGHLPPSVAQPVHLLGERLVAASEVPASRSPTPGMNASVGR